MDFLNIQETMIDKDILEIKILNIAAFLYASGLQLAGTKRINGEVYFMFRPKAEAETLLNDYFANTAAINPKELFSKLNDLRDLIFSSGKFNQK